MAFMALTENIIRTDRVPSALICNKLNRDRLIVRVVREHKMVRRMRLDIGRNRRLEPGKFRTGFLARKSKKQMLSKEFPSQLSAAVSALARLLPPSYSKCKFVSV